MAPVEEGLITWLSSCSSSLQISIVSALFIIIYVTLHSLCTSCYSISDGVSPRLLHRQEKTCIPSESPQNVRDTTHIQITNLPEPQSTEYLSAAEDLADHTYSVLEAELNEENPYEYISEPSLQPDKAEEDNESPSPAMRRLDDNHSVSAFIKPVNKPLTQSDQYLTDSTVVYAAVNWKTKSQKNISPLFYSETEVDMSEITREAVPPIPEKHF